MPEILSCDACKSELNEGAVRCAACGYQIGVVGRLSKMATVAASVVSVASLASIALTLYAEFLVAKRPDLKLSISEATFQDIINLTCAPVQSGGAQPTHPRVNGATPGTHLLVEGAITNEGNAAGELRILEGRIYPIFEDDPERLVPPTAWVGSPMGESRVFVQPETTVSVALRMPTGSLNSSLYSIKELKLGGPKPVGRIEFERERLEISYSVFEDGARKVKVFQNNIDIFLPRFSSKTWMVDGSRYVDLCNSK
jgi:DNA-directed RNA polymerase subunit RPC12/RpoP